MKSLAGISAISLVSNFLYVVVLPSWGRCSKSGPRGKIVDKKLHISARDSWYATSASDIPDASRMLAPVAMTIGALRMFAFSIFDFLYESVAVTTGDSVLGALVCWLLGDSVMRMKMSRLWPNCKFPRGICKATWACICCGVCLTTVCAPISSSCIDWGYVNVIVASVAKVACKFATAWTNTVPIMPASGMKA